MPLYSLDGVSPMVPADGLFWVAPNASLIGTVRLEVDASVWFGATLRGDNEWITVGARSNIQDNCVLHTDMGFPMGIGADCTVGHSAILHGCTIGAGSLIGMGATLLNGVRIGAHCLVGANALITEGKEFPDYSMIVGSPARVVRRLGPEDGARLVGAASQYVSKWQRFAVGLARAG